MQFTPDNFGPSNKPWARQVMKLLSELDRQVSRLQTAVDNATRVQTSATVAAGTGLAGVASASERATIADGGYDSSSGFAAGLAYATVATVTLRVPRSKSRAQIIAIGGAAVLDTTSGGAAVARGRILIGGTPSVEFVSSKDAGASAVNNVISASFGRSLTGLTPPSSSEAGVEVLDAMTSIEILFQVRVTNASAFPASPGNYASLTVNAVFFNS